MKSYEEMHVAFTETVRQELLSGLVQCTEEEQLIFKWMYVPRKRGQRIEETAVKETSVEEVVKNMDHDKLGWAIQQVKRTLEVRDAS